MGSAGVSPATAHMTAEGQNPAAALPQSAIPASHAGPSLKGLALRGAAWTVLGYGTGQVLRLGGNLILARLLFPEAFGLMALVNVVLQGLHMFSDVGVGPSIIQNKRGDDPRFLNTAWTLQIIRGLVLALCAWLIAWPVAQFYQQSQLLELISVTALTALIAGFNSTGLYTANRHMALGRLTAVDLAGQAASLVVMVVWALLVPSVWALVGGGLAHAVTRLLLSHFALPGPRNRIHWDPAAWRALFQFGRWIFLATGVHFIAGQADRLLLGHYLPLGVLGVYSVAFLLSDAVARVGSQVSHRVLYPAFSRVARHDRKRLGVVYYRTRLLLDAGFLSGAGLLMTVGQHVVHLLYDERYAAACWMIQILALRIAFNTTLPPAAMALSSIGFPRYGFIASCGRAAFLVLGIPLGWALGGIVGAVWAIALADLAMLPPLWWGMHRNGLLSLLRELRAVAFLLAGLLLGTLANHLVLA